MPKVETKKLIAMMLFSVLAISGWFASKEHWLIDYEMIHKVHRDHFRDPKLSDDIVIIALDIDSYMANPKFPWPRSDQAKIIKTLDAVGVERIFLNFFFPQASNPQDDRALEQALKESEAEIFTARLPAPLSDTKTANDLYEPFQPYATARSNGFRTSDLGYRIYGFYRDESPNQHQKEMAAEIARIDGEPGEIYPIDLAYDWEKLHKISAIEVLNNKADLTALKGKTVLYGYYSPNFGDTASHPNGGLIPGTAHIAISANLLMDGRPHILNPVFPVLIAFFLTGWLLWFARSKKAGLFSIFAILIFFAGATILESQHVFPKVLPAYALFIASAAYHRIAVYVDRVDEARRRDEEKSRFLARASHDLRQPIHAIGMLSARLGQTDLTPAQADFVAKIEKSAESASHMFQSLLDLSLVESGGFKPNFEPISLAQVFADIEKQHGTSAENAGIKLRMVPSNAGIKADPILLSAMVQNIMSNAIKYAPGSDILVGCRRCNNGIALWVCDRGQGISPDDLEKITNEYFRSSNGDHHEVQGSGLGLAIVKRLANAMKVEVDIQSALGLGTTVTVGEFELVDPPLLAPDETELPPATQLSGLRILLIDDDEESLLASQSILEQWGCQVDAKPRFPNAVEEADILISDFDFGNGQTLADHRERILELQHKGVPTVAISGHQRKNVEEAMNMGNLMVLSKPVRPAQLRSLLMSLKMNTTTNQHID